ncbi:patatin [Nitrospira sp. NS4]|uniref:patatin n=1 Tax=Nitrospira sp. NS4 TaxID=3414498 RepID=UPI003C3082D0
MKTKDWLYWALVTIGAITVLSGSLQMVAPGLVLTLIGGDMTPTSLHFFGIIGMFMVLFGGAMLQALLSPLHHPVVLFWASLQKFGASVAVGLGVLHLLFSPLALMVAGFDLLSGILGIWYWSRVRH